MECPKRRGQGRVIEQAGHDRFLERNRRAPFKLNEVRDCSALRPGEEKHVLIGHGLGQDLWLFLSAVDLFLIPPDRQVRMGLELRFELLDERKVFSCIAQKEAGHPRHPYR